MKKSRYRLHGIFLRQVFKFLLFMKITSLFLLVPLLQLSAKGYSQEKFSLNLDQVEATKVFANIQKTSAYRFFYLQHDIKKIGKVNIHVTDATIPEIMQKVLGNTLAYKILNNYMVVISPSQADLVNQIDVRGRVTDDAGEPLQGASVKVKGQSAGVTTEADGSFSIAVNAKAVLEISMVGYETIEIPVNGRNQLNNIVLKIADSGLNEVVVVGYGTRKKATLTGSVASVKGSELAKSPAGNFSNSLAGRLPGLVAITRTGEPGNDGSTLRIRGANTLGDNSPLVVVDGIAGRSLERLDPATIESVTVLKDASAAIYGAQTANGVILVTTKRGASGKPTLQLSLNQGWNTPTVLPKMVDAPLYAQIQNEISATYHPAAPLPYSEEDIQKYKDGSDPWLYPNTDWFKETIKKNSPQRYGNLTLSGGAEAIKYFISLGNNFTDGIYRNSAVNYSQTNFQSNIDAKVSNAIRLSFDIVGRQENRNYPGGGSNGGSADGAQNIFWALNRSFPTWPARWPNGLPGPDIEYGANPVVLVTDATGYTKPRNYVLQSNMKLLVTIPWVSGLSLTANAAVDKNFLSAKQFRKPWYLFIYLG
ncbi:SusC/RagA family TonB-linked outer membrane protein [Agriterribacter sp.]|uniref:SusC/RagA family TonB-linked outer membrane protein n=1 Tax=Agriterribacter sp. TaxID=2821509 RepID=UPI002BA41908|nr:SusC/RagA family TonB-linked outer membrane protein [Agriterribacter sp.]HTN08740.1 SusC/RagA family TonB-linked outer membrane protein [Agriterribacter sp.]